MLIGIGAGIGVIEALDLRCAIVKRILINIVQGRKCRLFKGNRGAVTVEYALCMVVAATIMLGIFLLFENMSVQIVDEFRQYVSSFPDA